MAELNWKESLRTLGLGLYAMQAEMIKEYQKLRWFSFRKKLVLSGAIAAIAEAAHAFKATWTALDQIEQKKGGVQ